MEPSCACDPVVSKASQPSVNTNMCWPAICATRASQYSRKSRTFSARSGLVGLDSGAVLIAFNKPFNVLCQFTDSAGRRTLADFVSVKDVYPAGRLDYDSEGLVLLTDDGKLQTRIADPRRRMKKTYLAQVERVPDADALSPLRGGVKLNGGMTAPAEARLSGRPGW